MSRLILLKGPLIRSGLLSAPSSVLSANLVFRGQSRHFQTRQSCMMQKASAQEEAESDQFGLGSKLARLESTSLKKPATKASFEFTSSKFLSKAAVDEADQFGTLTREHEQLSFQASVSSKRSFGPFEEEPSGHKSMEADSQTDEKKYDKVLNHIRLSNDPRERPNNENFYAHRMNELAQQGKVGLERIDSTLANRGPKMTDRSRTKIQEARNVFFVEMIEKDRFKPTFWLYKNMIRILSRAGDTKTTFDLFKHMMSNWTADDWTKASNVRELERIMTLLLLASSKIQSPEHAIKKIDSVRFFAKKHDLQLNAKHYSAMIMSYGKAGAVYEAFNVVDEMLEKKIRLDGDVFANLLCAAISQPEKGFHYALKIWQTLLQHKIKPDLRIFNLMLRAARDCNINKKSTSEVQRELELKRNLLRLHDPNKKQRRVAAASDQVELDEIKNEQIGERPADMGSKSVGDLEDDRPHPDDHSLSFKSDSNELISLKEDQVHVIDELKVVGKSLENQIMNLQWWQNIRTNVNKQDLARDLAKMRPDLRQSLLNSSQGESLLMSVNENVDEMIEKQLDFEDTKVERFNMIGGINGVFTAMENFRVKPDHRTSNILLELISNDADSEELLMKHVNYQVDIDFINFLIRRRIYRRDFDAVENAFKMIQEKKLSPNIRTFGNLAYQVGTAGCLEKFLNDMKAFGFRLNSIIVSTLLAQGFRRLNERLLAKLFEHINEEGIKLNQENIAQVESYMNAVKSIIIDTERKRPDSLSEAEKDLYERNRRFYNKTKRLLRKQPEFEAKFASRVAKVN